jgi:hypothetical protein
MTLVVPLMLPCSYVLDGGQKGKTIGYSPTTTYEFSTLAFDLEVFVDGHCG